MKTFNLYGDEWDERREREGWRIKEAFVGHRIGGELIGASTSEVERTLREGDVVCFPRIMFSRPGPPSDYWQGED